jgi:23S rRNA (adenine1618-N6)-methyltransferase
VPNRHNYILWLKELLDLTSSETDSSKEELSGLDIGTGASCIYPILACKQRPWYFVGIGECLPLSSKPMHY